MKKFLAVILILAVLAAALFIAGSHFGLFGLFGGGSGDGDGKSSENPVSESMSSQSIPAEENKVSEIRIDGNDIFFDDMPCENVDDLKQQIINIGTEREYTFVYDNALKSTYDEVQAMLSDLEDALGITINIQ